MVHKNRHQPVLLYIKSITSRYRFYFSTVHPCSIQLPSDQNRNLSQTNASYGVQCFPFLIQYTSRFHSASFNSSYILIGPIDSSFHFTAINRHLSGWTSDSLSTLTRLIDSLFWRMLALEKSRKPISLPAFFYQSSEEEPKVRGAVTHEAFFFPSFMSSLTAPLSLPQSAPATSVPNTTCYLASMPAGCHGHIYRWCGWALFSVHTSSPRALLSGDVTGRGIT